MSLKLLKKGTACDSLIRLKIAVKAWINPTYCIARKLPIMGQVS